MPEIPRSERKTQARALNQGMMQEFITGRARLV